LSKRIKRLIILFSAALILGLVFVFGLSSHIRSSTADSIFAKVEDVPSSYTVIVLGASVRANGNLSPILKDRVESALQLYTEGKVKRFLLSGDNDTKEYNEPEAMKEYLIDRGVPQDHIFLDYAGFDTYSSMYRASAIFEVKEAVVVTQNFHLPRALYIARNLGLNYVGYVGDKHVYTHEGANKKRELLANVKAYLELTFKKKPTYLGDKIPISGTSQSSY
jgi:SanA protein